VWVANDHFLVEFADEAELAPVAPRDHASISVRGGPEKRLIDEHPVHSGCALLLRHQNQNAGSRVGIEQCVGGCEVIRVWRVVSSKSHCGSCPDRGQFIFTFDGHASHIGNIVEIKNSLVGDLSHAKKVKGI